MKNIYIKKKLTFLTNVHCTISDAFRILTAACGPTIRYRLIGRA